MSRTRQSEDEQCGANCKTVAERMATVNGPCMLSTNPKNVPCKWQHMSDVTGEARTLFEWSRTWVPDTKHLERLLPDSFSSHSRDFHMLSTLRRTFSHSQSHTHRPT